MKLTDGLSGVPSDVRREDGLIDRNSPKALVSWFCVGKSVIASIWWKYEPDVLTFLDAPPMSL